MYVNASFAMLVCIELTCAVAVLGFARRRFSSRLIVYVFVSSIAAVAKAYYLYCVLTRLWPLLYKQVLYVLLSSVPLWIILTPLVVLVGAPAPPEGPSMRWRAIQAKHRVVSILVVAGFAFLPLLVGWGASVQSRNIVNLSVVAVAWLGAYASWKIISASSAWSQPFFDRSDRSGERP